MLSLIFAEEVKCVIIAIDVGNTNIVLGIFDNGSLKHNWRMNTDRNQTEDECALLIKGLLREASVTPQEVQGIIISSVVPSLMVALERMCRKYFDQEPLIVGPGIKTGLSIQYENPKDVGADRIVNAVAALAEYDPPLIIIDSGTANTFCYIDERGHYVGGAIAPGIQITADALFQYASKLPRVDLKLPEEVVGKNTVTSMQSGILYGYVGQVDGMVKRMKKWSGQNPKVIATGGLIDLIAAESEQIDVVEPFLTLKGLHLLYQKNKTLVNK